MDDMNINKIKPVPPAYEEIIQNEAKKSSKSKGDVSTLSKAGKTTDPQGLETLPSSGAPSPKQLPPPAPKQPMGNYLQSLGDANQMATFKVNLLPGADNIMGAIMEATLNANTSVQTAVTSNWANNLANNMAILSFGQSGAEAQLLGGAEQAKATTAQMTETAILGTVTAAVGVLSIGCSLVGGFADEAALAPEKSIASKGLNQAGENASESAANAPKEEVVVSPANKAPGAGGDSSNAAQNAGNPKTNVSNTQTAKQGALGRLSAMWKSSNPNSGRFALVQNASQILVGSGAGAGATQLVTSLVYKRQEAAAQAAQGFQQANSQLATSRSQAASNTYGTQNSLVQNLQGQLTQILGSISTAAQAANFSSLWRG